MKFTPVILGLALLAMVSAAHAAEDSTVNVLVNPLALIAGPNVQADFRISDNWTLGPQLLYVDRKIGDYDFRAFSAGLNATHYFNKVFTTGWYTQAGVGYGYSKVVAGASSDSEFYYHTNGVYVHGMGGYHWFWGDFNLRLGGGLTLTPGHTERRNGNGETTQNGSSLRAGLGLDASLGWTF